MPYKIVKEGTGFVVMDKKGKQFSKKPLSKKIARKQQIAIALSESKKTGKPVSSFFFG
jgi:hypothetical protein